MMAQKIEIKCSQPLVILVMIRINRLVPGLPREIRQWSFRDHTDASFARQRNDVRDRSLIGDIDGGLQNIEGVALDREARAVIISAVAEITHPAAISRRL